MNHDLNLKTSVISYTTLNLIYIIIDLQLKNTNFTYKNIKVKNDNAININVSSLKG